MSTPPAVNNESPKPQASPNTSKNSPSSHIFIAVCFILMLGIVAFSIYYISNLGQDILLQFEAVAETLPMPNAPADQPINQTITVEVNRSSLLSADYLAVVLPILITVAGAFIVFLGMNRLKMYDERIDSTRADLLAELQTMVDNRVAATQSVQINVIRNELTNEHKSFMKDITFERESLEKTRTVFVENIIAKESELQTFVDNGKKSLSETTQTISDFIKNLEDRYEWLMEAIRTKTYDPDIYTVYDAHRAVEKLRALRPTGYIQFIQNIVAKVTSENFSGDSADYHNLSAELERGYLYQESYKVLKKGLESFPEDTDLLGDLLDNITNSSVATFEYNEAELSDSFPQVPAKQAAAHDALTRLNNLDKKRWTWRCYIFASDYYRSIGDFNNALELVNSCIQNLPLKQQGYQKKAELIQQMNPGMDGIEESIAFLKNEVIDKGYPYPQCANTLGKLYMELGQYDNALEAFDRAVLALAQDQPGINTSYVFFHRATCHDQVFFSNPSQSNVRHLLDAYLDYKTALDTEGLAPSSVSTVHNRLELLKRYLPDTNDEA